jgi:hypothetical protein
MRRPREKVSKKKATVQFRIYAQRKQKLSLDGTSAKACDSEDLLRS